MAPYAFSLELAVLASTRGLLDLEHWATDLMTQDAVHFVTALLAFMGVCFSKCLLLNDEWVLFVF